MSIDRRCLSVLECIVEALAESVPDYVCTVSCSPCPSASGHADSEHRYIGVGEGNL